MLVVMYHTLCLVIHLNNHYTNYYTIQRVVLQNTHPLYCVPITQTPSHKYTLQNICKHHNTFVHKPIPLKICKLRTQSHSTQSHNIICTITQHTLHNHRTHSAQSHNLFCTITQHISHNPTTTHPQSRNKPCTITQHILHNHTPNSAQSHNLG